MGIKDGFWDSFHDRETGLLGSRCFTRRFSSNESIVSRLGLYEEIDGYNARVKTVEFNSGGNLLVSGSSDKPIIVWDWERRIRLLSYDSGHSTVIDTKIIPLTDNKRIATASYDGQVRLGEVLEDGRVHTKSLGRYRFCVCKIAVEPGNPYRLYCCGEDGFIREFDLRSNCAKELLHCSRLSKGRYNPEEMGLNDIVIDPRNPNYCCTGGTDAYARVYDIRKLQQGDASSNVDKPVDIFCPNHLIKTSGIWVSGLAYSNSSELVVYYCNDHIYLFQKNMGFGSSIDKPQGFFGHRNDFSSTGVSFFGPNDDYVMTGSSCGHIFIWKKIGAKLIRVIKGKTFQVKPHPHLPIIATCGPEMTVKFLGPMTNDDHPLPCDIEKIMESNRMDTENTVQRYVNQFDIMEDHAQTIEDADPCLERQYIILVSAYYASLMLAKAGSIRSLANGDTKKMELGL